MKKTITILSDCNRLLLSSYDLSAFGGFIRHFFGGVSNQLQIIY